MNLINRLDARMRVIRKSKKTNKQKAGIKFEDIAKIVPTDRYRRDYAEAVMLDQEMPGTLQDLSLDILIEMHKVEYILNPIILRLYLKMINI